MQPILNQISPMALVMGGTNGIGRASAIKLAQHGHDVIIVGRNAIVGAEVVKEIEKAGRKAYFVQGDVSLMREVQRIAAEIHKITNKINVLLHCTDVAIKKRVDTAEGIELCFATNFLSRVLMNDLLLDLLKAGAPSRILHVATPGVDWKIDAKLVPPPPSMSAIKAHNMGQSSNNLYTVDMAERIKNTGVSINVMGPGWVDTGFHKKIAEESYIIKILMSAARFSLKMLTTMVYTAEQCADNVVHVLLSKETSEWNGQFIKPNGRELEKISKSYQDNQRRKDYMERTQAAIQQALKSAMPG